jgi:energy-coupling factor transporter ATP-binding protein EcfA2
MLRAVAVTDNAATGGADPSEQPPDALIEATTALLSAVTAITLPFNLATAEPARRARTEIEHILTAAILPRLRTPDAPLLCALAGPTGVGKSTLLNALAGATVSATGPLRPTTRTPVLVCNPADLADPATAEELADELTGGARESGTGEDAARHEGVAVADGDALADSAAATGVVEQVGAGDDDDVEVGAGEPGAGAAARVSVLEPGSTERLVSVGERQHAAQHTPAEAPAPAEQPMSAEAQLSVGASVPMVHLAAADVPTPMTGLTPADAPTPMGAPTAGDATAVVSPTAADAPTPMTDLTPPDAPTPTGAPPAGDATPVVSPTAADAPPPMADLTPANAPSPTGAPTAGDATPVVSPTAADAPTPIADPMAADTPAPIADPMAADESMSAADESMRAGVPVLRADESVPAELPATLGRSRLAAGWGGRRRGRGVAAGLGARVGAEFASLLSSPLPSPSLPRGVAVVDTVDGDVAVVGAADVVVVVVSAERYADAAVWRILRRVGGSGVPVVVVLGRVSVGVVEEVSGAFVELLRVNGLGAVPFFVVEEVGGAGGAEPGGQAGTQHGSQDGSQGEAHDGAQREARGGVQGGAQHDARDGVQGDARSMVLGVSQGAGDAHDARWAPREGAVRGEAVGEGADQGLERGGEPARGEGSEHATRQLGSSSGPGVWRLGDRLQLDVGQPGGGSEPGTRRLGDGSEPGVRQPGDRSEQAADQGGEGAAQAVAGRDVGVDGEGARARGAFFGDSDALGMDGGQGESGAGVGGGAPGEGGYGDGGPERSGGPAGGTGIEVGDGGGSGCESGSGPQADSESGAEAESGSGSGYTSGSGYGAGSRSALVIGDGTPLVPEAAVAGLRGWLRDAGAVTAVRVRIGMLGVAGRLDSVDRLVGELADAWEGQRLALQVLHQGLERVHTAERVRFRGCVDGGELLGGEVRIRWQELLGSGRVSALFEAEDAGRKRRKRKRAEADWSARFHNPTAHDAATAPLRAALVEAVARGYRAALERAARKTVDQWELTPGAPEPGPVDDATRRAIDPARAAVEWLDHLPTLILDQGHSRRTTRTIGPAGAHIRSAALVLGVAALAGNANGEGIQSGSEVPEGRGGVEEAVVRYDDPAATAAVGLLRTMFGHEDADRLLATAITALKDGNARLLERASEPHRVQLAAYTLDPRQAQALAEARAAVARARNEGD